MKSRIVLAALLLLSLAGPVLADPEREPRYLRLYMTDMHGWGEIDSMSMVLGDTLFVSLIIEDAAGNPVTGQRIRIQSRLGNRITTENGYSDKDGWIHAEITAGKVGEDLVGFQAGAAQAQLKLIVAGDEAELPPTQGKLGAAQPLVVDYPGALQWEELADVVAGKDFGPPTFGPKVSQLDGQQVILQGFMLPMENADKQSHFVLSANPPHCYFCMPGGAESMVEIFAAPPIAFSYDPIVVQGTLHLIRGDESLGLYYQLKGVRQLQ